MNESGTYRTTTATATLSVTTNGVANIELIADDISHIIDSGGSFLLGAEAGSIEYGVTATAGVTDMTVNVTETVSGNTITTSAVLA